MNTGDLKEKKETTMALLRQKMKQWLRGGVLSSWVSEDEEGESKRGKPCSRAKHEVIKW